MSEGGEGRAPRSVIHKSKGILSDTSRVRDSRGEGEKGQSKQDGRDDYEGANGRVNMVVGETTPA